MNHCWNVAWVSSRPDGGGFSWAAAGALERQMLYQLIAAMIDPADTRSEMPLNPRRSCVRR